MSEGVGHQEGLSSARRRQLVEGAEDAGGAAVEDVGVDPGGADVGMAEQLLDGADVVAALQQAGGEAVAEDVRADELRPAERYATTSCWPTEDEKSRICLAR